VRCATQIVAPLGSEFIDERFATIQCIESKQDLAGLAPQGCSISAKAIKCEVGQIGQTQKATREVSGCIDGSSTIFGAPSWVGRLFRS
jgi:hypothetical protein